MSVGKPEEKLENYSEEDRKLLVSILNEYSEKLLISCDKIDKSLALQSRKLFDVNAFMLCFVFCVISTYLVEINSDVISFLYRIFGLFRPVTTWFFTALSMITLFSFVAKLFEFSNTIFKINDLIRDARTLAKKLEKVVQIVSQMQEHSENRLASRVEMDLRLADAEIALDHYESVSRRRKGFKFLGRSLTSLSRSRSATS